MLVYQRVHMVIFHSHVSLPEGIGPQPLEIQIEVTGLLDRQRVKHGQHVTLWKIWVRQLGLVFPIYRKMMKHVPNHQPVLSFFFCNPHIKYEANQLGTSSVQVETTGFFMCSSQIGFDTDATATTIFKTMAPLRFQCCSDDLTQLMTRRNVNICSLFPFSKTQKQWAVEGRLSYSID